LKYPVVRIIPLGLKKPALAGIQELIRAVSQKRRHDD